MANLRLFPNQVKVPCGTFNIGLHKESRDVALK